MHRAFEPETAHHDSITTEGPHKLYTRVVDTAGNESAWREDTIGIDKTVPALTVDCGEFHDH